MSTGPQVSDYASALDFLLHRINYERTTSIPYRSSEFKLDRMRKLLTLLGDPHLGLKAVHIAGTKGKGSTAAMTANVLQAAGYRTGLYTSPHLERIEERISIDGQICSEANFAALTAELQAATARLDGEMRGEPEATGPTFFEITTAMAFLYFARSNLDVAVLEVGLGGRLDSTNVCLPEVCVITSISFDHMRQLGNTLAAIAGEKAGIIKPGVPVVAGVVEPEPRDVIRERAEASGAPLVQRGVAYDFRVQGSGFRGLGTGDKGTGGQGGVEEAFDYFEPARNPTHELTEIWLGMLGVHQAANAAAAIAAIGQLRRRGWSISDEAIRQGLATARCPGRIEVVRERPTVIVDVAHNPASVQALLEVLDKQFSARRKILIFASSKDKDYEAMLRLVVPAFDVVILTQYIDNPRATDPETLLVAALGLRNAGDGRQALPALHATARPEYAWRLARAIAEPGDLIAIAGSFFLAAELRRRVLEDKVERVSA